MEIPTGFTPRFTIYGIHTATRFTIFTYWLIRWALIVAISVVVSVELWDIYGATESAGVATYSSGALFVQLIVYVNLCNPVY